MSQLAWGWQQRETGYVFVALFKIYRRTWYFSTCFAGSCNDWTCPSVVKADFGQAIPIRQRPACLAIFVESLPGKAGHNLAVERLSEFAELPAVSPDAAQSPYHM